MLPLKYIYIYIHFIKPSEREYIHIKRIKEYVNPILQAAHKAKEKIVLLTFT